MIQCMVENPPKKSNDPYKIGVIGLTIIVSFYSPNMAPQVGLEPTTLRLTVAKNDVLNEFLLLYANRLFKASCDSLVTAKGPCYCLTSSHSALSCDKSLHIHKNVRPVVFL